MKFFKEYVAYIKDNPADVWFKRKLYGWGWTPATWQGWLITAVFIAAILAFSLTLDENATTNDVLFTFLLPVILITISFVRIIYLKGEKPKWMWGLPKDDNK